MIPVDVPGINEAGAGGALEPTLALNATITAALASLLTAPADVPSVVTTVQAQLGGTLAQAIVVVWDYLDDIYVSAGANQPNVNEYFTRLGIEYAKYLKDGGAALVEVTAKYVADGGDAGTVPDRQQSLHDNLLGNLQTAGLDQRYGVDSAMNLVMQGLISAIDADLLTRAYNDGSETNAAQAAQTLAWDMAKGYVPAASGTLTATDVDAGEVLTWSISGASSYGTMTIDAGTGVWTYRLDNADGDTQALTQGQVVSETFTATVTDEFGAVDTQTVTITVTGSNDAPTTTPVTLAAIAEDSGARLITQAELLAKPRTSTSGR